MYLRYILARILDRQRWGIPVTAKNLVLLQVDMYRMSPISRQVGQQPLLHALLLNGETELVAIHELAVNGPLPVQPIELERSHDTRRGVGAGKVVEGDIRG